MVVWLVFCTVCATVSIRSKQNKQNNSKRIHPRDEHHNKENSVNVLIQSSCRTPKYGMDVDKLLIYTDNCGGENKNRRMMNQLATTPKAIFREGVEMVMNESYHNKWYQGMIIVMSSSFSIIKDAFLEHIETLL